MTGNVFMRGEGQLRRSVLALVQRIRPDPMRDRLGDSTAVVAATISANDDLSVSRRVALLPFNTGVVSALIALGSQVLIARWLGEHEYGVFVIVWVTAVIVGGLASIVQQILKNQRFQVSPLRFIPQYIELKRDGLLRGIVIGAPIFGLASATVIASIGAGALWLFGDVLSSYYVMPLFLAAICLPMLALSEIQDGIARAFIWPGLALAPTFILRPVAIIAFMWLALRFGGPASAVTAMWATIAACYLVTCLQALAL